MSTKSAGESIVSVTRMREERGGIGVLSAADDGPAPRLAGKERSVSRFGIAMLHLLAVTTRT